VQSDQPNQDTNNARCPGRTPPDHGWRLSAPARKRVRQEARALTVCSDGFSTLRKHPVPSLLPASSRPSIAHGPQTASLIQEG